MLSEVVAEQVFRHRKRAGLTHVTLAERCKSLGWDALTPASISNIETGRRGKDGKRRREVTVDELVVLARALKVPPVLLLAPLEHEGEVEILPDFEVSSLDAYEYLIGGQVAADDDYVLGNKGRRHRDLIVKTYHDHYRAMGEWWSSATQDRDAATAAKWRDEVKRLEQVMKENQWRIPPVSDWFDEGEVPG